MRCASRWDRVGRVYRNLVGELIVFALCVACGGKSNSEGEASAGGGNQTGIGGSSASSPSTIVAAGGLQATVASGGASSSVSSALGGSYGLGGSVAIVGAAGLALQAFCAGDVNKVKDRDLVMEPVATNHASGVAMDCCDGFDIALHTRQTLGFDLSLEFIYSATYPGPSGTYSLGSSSPRISGQIGKFGADVSDPLGGSIAFSGAMSGSDPWHVSLCAAVDDSAKVLPGARIYIPNAIVMPSTWTKRFQIFLLADPAITPNQANGIALGALVLASSPWLDLYRIAFVEKSTGDIVLTPGYASGSSLRSQLGDVSVAGRPFVVVADNEPIYLGTFYRAVSSIGPIGPYITVEDITDDRMPLSAPKQGSDPLFIDPRFDSRILKALTESGKLAP